MTATASQDVVVRITNLRVPTIIGINDWEREAEQEVVINITAHFDAGRAIASDMIEDTIDYKSLKIRIVDAVRRSRYNLLESLTHHVLECVLDDPGIHSAVVRIDKPSALRFADSVSIEMRGEKGL